MQTKYFSSLYLIITMFLYILFEIRFTLTNKTLQRDKWFKLSRLKRQCYEQEKKKKKTKWVFNFLTTLRGFIYTGYCSRTEWISGKKLRQRLILTVMSPLSKHPTRLVTIDFQIKFMLINVVLKLRQASVFQEVTSILKELRRVQHQLEGEPQTT